ncbi:Nitroreductase family protein [Parapedobacter composti]|uniref:Nitroreductase family protein n=1 Tax=Parapedobacter composti TaxID=623281 RepID=A0A1I1IEG6_9SPHI|nr:Rv1355c family protein [Parapedobacter composti]SFC31610.1 Nitroreductase family protein [Parapedobacter composti]
MASKVSIPEFLAERSRGQFDDNGFLPFFFRLTNGKDRQALKVLLEEKPYIKVFDTMASQLKELVKSAQPNRSLTNEEIEHAVKSRLDGVSLHDYGVWVYYPWNEKLVHILDEQEFVLMRTNRNKYKITDEEAALLAEKKVGVIGLSVGQSVSLTLAMERGFGELRIADFDELEITNLNRLRSGLHNIGLKKTIIVAREIAEIDPFLRITCFHDGITAHNLDAFLLEGGKLDVLIDECDGVDVKISCRIAARKYRIPVLMEASDRGTIDIERFDLEPERPILHGYVEHLDVSNFGSLKTNEEKLPYMVAFAGLETLSARMKASAIEIGQTISTWPQLASAVTMGGGITADICRRVLLGHLNHSGRYFIDVEELIADPKKPIQPFVYLQRSLTRDEMLALAGQVPVLADNAITDKLTIRTLVEAAAIAPSAGNSQPWKWYFDGKQLYLFHDIERSESFGDYANMASYMSLGTAIENLHIKASDLGLEVISKLFPVVGQPLLVGVFGFLPKNGLARDQLADYLSIRFTNRRLGHGGELSPIHAREFNEAISDVEGARLYMLGQGYKKDKIAEIAGKSEKLRIFIPQGHHELFEREIRWNVAGAEKIKDGLDLRTLELSVKDAIGFRMARDPRAIQLIAEWNLGTALESATAKLVSSSSAVGLITMPKFDGVDGIAAGRAAERIWLTATKHGLSLQPVLASVLHFARLKYAHGEGMPLNVSKQFESMYREFVAVFGYNEQVEVPFFLFRCFVGGGRPDIRSARIDLADVYINKE